MAGQGTLGERIRELRLRRQMSQAQLAWPELSDSYVSLIESGRRTPAQPVVSLLARKLDCSSSYLMTGVTEESLTGLQETLRYAEIALDNGEAEEARNRFAEVLPDPALDDLPQLAYQAHWGYARALEASGDLDAAVDELRRTIKMISPVGEPREWAELHIALSRCHRELGDITAGIRVGEEALAELTETGGAWTDEMVMLGATVLAGYGQRGDLTYARKLADDLIERAERIGTPRALMAAYWNAAWVSESRGEIHDALRLAERAIALLGEEDDPRNLGRLRASYGRFLLMAHPDRAAEALDVLCRAERELAESAASPIDTAWCLTYQARAHIVLGRPQEAAERAERAAETLAGNAGLARAEARMVLGDAYVRLNRRDEGVAALFETLTLLEKMRAHRSAARTWYALAELLGAAGRAEDQQNALKHALACMDL